MISSVKSDMSNCDGTFEDEEQLWADRNGLRKYTASIHHVQMFTELKDLHDLGCDDDQHISLKCGRGRDVGSQQSYLS
jgi:hypothetical protein